MTLSAQSFDRLEVNREWFVPVFFRDAIYPEDAIPGSFKTMGGMGKGFRMLQGLFVKAFGPRQDELARNNELGSRKENEGFASVLLKNFPAKKFQIEAFLMFIFAPVPEESLPLGVVPVDNKTQPAECSEFPAFAKAMMERWV